MLGYHRPFSWPTYLAETASRAVPASAFKATVPIHSAFKKGMKVEVVDRRNPILVRVATIADVLLRQIKVSACSGVPSPREAFDNPGTYGFHICNVIFVLDQTSFNR